MTGKAPLSVPQYERMANDLQAMSEAIRARPEIELSFRRTAGDIEQGDAGG